MGHRFWIGWLVWLIGVSAACGEQYQVVIIAKKRTPVRTDPSPTAKIVMRLAKGRRVQVMGPPQQNFYQLYTLNNQGAWISVNDARPEPPPPPRKVVAERQAASERKSSEEPEGERFKRFTFDLGGSSGVSNGISFFEIHGGLNYYILRWLVWRNAPFYRFASGPLASLYGLDTSLLAVYQIARGDIAPVIQFGPGFRFVSSGNHAPFLAAALGGRLGPLNLTFSVQYLFNSALNPGMSNDFLYGLAFSAGGSF